MFRTITKAPTLFAIVAISMLSVSVDASASVNDRLEVDGTGHTVIPAPGYKKTKHNGETMLCSDSTDSCLVIRIPTKIRNMNDFDRGKLVRTYASDKKDKLVSFRDFDFGNYKGIIFETNNGTYRAWTLFFGDHNSATIAYVNVNLKFADSKSERTVHSMLKTLSKGSL